MDKKGQTPLNVECLSIREATLKGEMVKGLSARAQEELKCKQEATIAAAVAVETGLDANAVENEYGIDLAETMVGLSDTAEFIKSRNAQMMIAEMSAADQEDGETGKDGETAGETSGATESEGTNAEDESEDGGDAGETNGAE